MTRFFGGVPITGEKILKDAVYDVSYFTGVGGFFTGNIPPATGAPTSHYPVKYEPAPAVYGPNAIYVWVTSTTTVSLYMEVAGTVNFVDGSPAQDINPEQDYYIDTAKDAISAGVGYFATRQALLASSLEISGGISSGVASTVAKSFVSRIPAVALGVGSVWVAQQALNYAKYALQAPSQAPSVKINRTSSIKYYNPPPNSLQDSANNSVNSSSFSPNFISNYDITAQFYDSYPAWHSGQRHPHEAEMVSGVADLIYQELKNDAVGINDIDFKNSDFWNDFKSSIRNTIQDVIQKRATDSYKNDLNEFVKKLEKLSTSLTDIHSDLKYLSNTMYDFSIGLDIDSIMKKYFTVPILNEPILTKNIAKVLEDKSLSSDYIVVEGGEY